MHARKCFETITPFWSFEPDNHFPVCIISLYVRENRTRDVERSANCNDSFYLRQTDGQADTPFSEAQNYALIFPSQRSGTSGCFPGKFFDYCGNESGLLLPENFIEFYIRRFISRGIKISATERFYRMDHPR
ncbi:hypothetical protein WA026_011218 [Henosepilachna vigintioctopunctata]|uniref:Uncharacterized protein n=1 Tax=Henosepilachna vigintioctopunctata TaxID=420089 RepID=A0AAW1U9W6_9CUCU